MMHRVLVENWGAEKAVAEAHKKVVEITRGIRRDRKQSGPEESLLGNLAAGTCQRQGTACHQRHVFDRMAFTYHMQDRFFALTNRVNRGEV